MAQTKAQLIDGKSATIEFSGGSSSAPAITFTGDTNTGIYSPGADQVAISTGGSGRLFVDSSGRVGIGTTSPGYLLDVASSVAQVGNSTDAFIQYKSTAGNWHVGANSSNAYVFYSGTYGSGTERARIDSSGRLLVGTSTSRSNWYNTTGLDDNLQIEGTTHAGSGFSIVRSNNFGGHIELGGHGGTTIGSYTLVSSTANLGSISFQGADGTEFVEAASIACNVDGPPGANDMPGRLVFSTTADGASSPTERMRITNGGVILAGGLTSTRPFITLGTPAFQTGGSAGYLVTNGSSDAQFGFDRISFTGPQYYVLNGSSTGVILTSGSTAWAAQSDERNKTNLSPILDGLTKVGSLRAVTGRYKTDEDGVSRSFLIAQDVQEILPEAVSASDDDEGTLNLRYTEVIPLLVAALKESKERIETLEAKVAALEAS